jgi:hypothetical protein
MKKTVIMLAALLMTSTAAYTSELMSGNKLLAFCQSTDDGDRSFCLGYVLGVWSELPDMCSPGILEAGQLAKVVGRYLEANPQNLHLNSTTLVEVAVRNAWPCK